MATVVLSVVGGLVALLLAYQLKKLDDLATVMGARYDSLTTAMHTGFLDLTKAQAATDIHVAALEHQLVTTTQRFELRFDGIDQRFDGVDQRFDGVDQRLDGIDQRLDGVDQRLDSLDRGLGDVATRLQQVDEKLDRHLAAPHPS